jgi:hypothetical protein
MSREELKTMYSADRSRRVVIFRRLSGSYGFEEQVPEPHPGVSWEESGYDSASRFDSDSGFTVPLG